jgi:DNA replication protein DnaC
MLDYGQGLHLHGPNGTGKTSIAVLAAMEALRLGASVLFVTAEQLRRASIEDIWFDESQLLLDRAREVDLLVVDDLGKEHRGDSGYAERLLEDVLRQRSSRRLTTIFTTNVPVGSAEKKSGLFGIYSQSMLDVSRESMRPLQVSGANVRRSAEPLNW